MSESAAHAEAVGLPAGYVFDDYVNSEELSGLLQSSFDDFNLSAQYLENERLLQYALGVRSIDVAVRQSAELVGYGGLVCLGDGRGEMGRLVVDRSHTGRGIGSAIIDERIRIAKTVGLRRLIIEGLEDPAREKHYTARHFKIVHGGRLLLNL